MDHSASGVPFGILSGATSTSSPLLPRAFLFRVVSRAVCSLFFCVLISESTLASSVTLTWDASIDAGVAGYFLYVGTATPSYSAKLDVGNNNTGTVSGLMQGQTYYFAVTAYDMYGHESSFSSPAVSAATPDTISPTVTITSPLNGTSVKKNSTVTIAASASDNAGVVKVDFYINGRLTCSDATTPYTCAWKVPGAPGRTYQFQATAYDAAGHTGSSDIVTVTAP